MILRTHGYLLGTPRLIVNIFSVSGEVAIWHVCLSIIVEGHRLRSAISIPIPPASCRGVCYRKRSCFKAWKYLAWRTMTRWSQDGGVIFRTMRFGQILSGGDLFYLHIVQSYWLRELFPHTMYLIVRSRPIRTRIDHSQPMKSLLIIIAVLTHQFLYEKTEKKYFFC